MATSRRGWVNAQRGVGSTPPLAPGPRGPGGTTLARPGARWVQGFYDLVLVAGLVLAATVMIVLVTRESTGEPPALLGLVPVLAVVAHVVVFAFWPWMRDGRTPGMGMQDLRVLRLDGRTPGLGQYLARWLFLLVVDQLIYGLVGLLIMSGTRRRQRLGDLVAGTLVVEAPRSEDPDDLDD